VLHWALRQVLGEHVAQAGSLVAPDRLRFDITHDGPLSEDEIRRIEDLANDLIFRNVSAEIEQRTYAQAIADGAIAMFQEKYADDVRVVRFGPSLELCGGTHARATGEIGCIRIVGQSALGAGVRRIEAQTGFGVIEGARRDAGLLRESAELLRVAPAELAERLRRLLEREKTLSREVEKLRAELRRGGAADPLAGVREVAGVKLIATEVEGAEPKELRSMIDELKQRIGSGIIVLGTRSRGKAALAVGVTKDLTDRFRAGDLVKQLAELVGGSGGGRPDFAQAGGPRADDLPRALEGVDALIAS
jgi:alanyl-tRNA synthetase